MTKKKPKLVEVPEPQQNNDRYWSISIGFYPGILFGFRTYEEKDFNTHVLYLPFVDIAFEIDN
jgi:hypothetical protein